MWIRVRAPGSCGELIQGTINNRPFLVTCPIDLYSTVTVTDDAQQNITGLGPKAYMAYRKTLELCGVSPYEYSVSLISELPSGKGMASSSADIAAVCQAVALSVNRQLSENQLAAIATAIEPTDGIFHNNIVAFNHITGNCDYQFAATPELTIAIFDSGGSVDTLNFNRRHDLQYLHAQNESRIREALELLKTGVQTADAKLIGRAATISSLANQTILYKPHLPELIELTDYYGGVGVNVAHSGTVIGLLFANDNIAGLPAAVEAINNNYGQVRYMKTVRLTSGGLITEKETKHEQ